jgi:hypothetical protein
MDGAPDTGPAIGARIRVFWTQERRWFKGLVTANALEEGRRIHKIEYDDGEALWHSMTNEVWLLLTGKEAVASAAARSMPQSASRVCSDAAKSKKTRTAAGPRLTKVACPRPKLAAVDGDAPRVSQPELPLMRASLDAADVEVFPCGVVKVKRCLGREERQVMWDTVICAGFDYREVGADAGTTDPDYLVKKGANRLYTNAKGAPDILLHYNYYEKPAIHQPAPLTILRAADAVFRAVAALDVARGILEPEGDDVESAGGAEEAVETERDGNVDPMTRRVEPEDAFFARHAEALRQKNLRSAAAMLDSHQVDMGAPSGAGLGDGGTREEQRMFLWPRRPNFRSVLAIGYRPSDTFRWHTDLAGEEGWVCSLSVGATCIFEYLPTAAPSAVRRARAQHDCQAVRIEIESGDAILFNGGLLAHRLVEVKQSSRHPPETEQMAPYVRLNCQVRVYGACADSDLDHLRARGLENTAGEAQSFSGRVWSRSLKERCAAEGGEGTEGGKED